MTLLPRSLYGRLLALSALLTALALIVAAFAIGHVLDRFVTETLDERLADTLSTLSGAVRKDGSLDAAYFRRFDTLSARDADWRVDAPGGSAGSAMIDGNWGVSSAKDQVLPPIAGMQKRPRDGLPGPPRVIDGTWPFDIRLPSGERVHGRVETVPTDRGPALIAVAVPRALIDRPIRAILAPLALSLLVLGVALGGATLVQLRLGLRPLGRLRTGLAAIRAGTARTLPEDQPTELAPLAREINALLAENAAALANARGHVANLAHGLKTPLATLALALPAHDPDGSLAAQVARIDHAVRHHLGRARAATPGSALRFATPLAPVVADLTTALSRIHAGRGVTASATIDAALSVAVDRQDLDELIGNLLDNAWRFAATRITLDAAPARDARFVRLTIADDGRGIAPDARAAALVAGQRLDERGDGHGFGLSIAHELATLYGGALALETASLGGLAAIVTLPAARFVEA